MMTPTTPEKWFFLPDLITATTEKQVYNQMFTDDDDVAANVGNKEASDADKTDAGEEDDEANSSEDFVERYTELAVHLRDVTNEGLEETDAATSPTNKPNIKMTVCVPDVGEVHKFRCW
eukprot:Seg1949.4 transcript_id=Seg1949.4/GoldUCD/mRNA.D3Y31 product="hypothetical protein" protein_id=Seg1949.4/GoldUCD/D3Y31